MSPFIFLFPTLLGANHLAMSRWSPVYTAFNSEQKCEWLAWTNTVLFQFSFTTAYLGFGVSGYRLGTLFGAYSLCDTAFLPFYNRDNLMYVHHALSLLVMYLSYVFGYTEETAAAVIYLESSNILLGITWLLNRAGYGKTLAMKGIGACALLVYLLNRAVLFPYHLIYVAPHRLAIFMIPFVPMNYFWCWKLIRYYAHIAFGIKGGH